MSDYKNLNEEDLEKANGGSVLYSGTLEEAKTKYIHSVNDEVDVSIEGIGFVKGTVTKRGIGFYLYGGCSPRYDNYYYCEIPNMPNKNGWYKSFISSCTFGPKTDTEIGLVVDSVEC